jgi:hypothetical protein
MTQAQEPVANDQDAGSHIETIEPSGATDDIRYLLHQQNKAGDEKHGRPDVLAEEPGRLQPDAPRAATSGGLASQVIDDVDEQLPDTTQSTISGGQVAKESKRGAY